ncbi:MAG: ankyrin repeat domain-containing protein [Planctomycetota bacterium]|jgi:ankyrin repeat protein
MTGEIFSAESFLWSCLWQSTIFVAAGLLGSFLLRYRSARAHQVLFLSMIAAVIVPAASILVKHYELGVFVAKPVVILTPAEDLAGASNYGASGIISAEGIKHEPGPAEKDLPPVLSGSQSSKFPWARVVLYGWIAASLILAVRLAVTFVLGARLLGRVTPLECDRIIQALHLANVRLRISKDIKIYSSPRVNSPVIWCWRRRPVLLVPSAAVRFDNGVDWAGVLCHELAHWKRRDHISGLLAELAVCILPWHPLLWWVKSRLISLSEEACDDWVVATGQPSEDYAESLLDLRPGGQMAFVPAVVSSKRGLAGRIRRILKDSCGNPRTGMKWALVVSFVVVCLAVGIAFAQTRPAESETITESQAKPAKTLHEAATDGDLEQVKLFITKGVDVNSKDDWGRTALHKAAQNGHADVVKFLIDSNADINVKDRSQMTPLHYAAGKADKKSVELLLSKGADINAKDRNGGTALYEAMTSVAAGGKEVVGLLLAKGAKVSDYHLAAYTGDIEKLKKSLQEGINVNMPGDCESTALHFAACSGKKETVEFLIGKGATVNAIDAGGLTPLYHAASHNYEDIADFLLSKGADIEMKDNQGYTLLYSAIWYTNKDAAKFLDVNAKDEYGFTPLIAAIWMMDKDMMELLISKGANVNVQDGDGYTPLVWSIWMADKDMVELIINKGADVNTADKAGYTPLYWAAMQGSKDLVELLTAKGASGGPTIHLAAAKGDLDQVKAFIEKGIDVNAKDKLGLTPLQLAVFTDSNDLVEFLVAKDADVNAKDGVGCTPVHGACQQGRMSTTELLIAKGADINAKANNGMTPLHRAAQRGNLEMVKLLLAKGADVNPHMDIKEKLTGGYTPLHFAAQSNRNTVVEPLINKGADVNAKNRWEQTPLHTAARYGRPRVAGILINCGADTEAKDNRGMTPLHLAAGSMEGGVSLGPRRQITVRLLVTNGANVNAEDNNSRTPLWYAKNKGLAEIVELLREHGAKE